jgi:hypothetical protein
MPDGAILLCSKTTLVCVKATFVCNEHVHFLVQEGTTFGAHQQFWCPSEQFQSVRKQRWCQQSNFDAWGHNFGANTTTLVPTPQLLCATEQLWFFGA